MDIHDQIPYSDHHALEQAEVAPHKILLDALKLLEAPQVDHNELRKVYAEIGKLKAQPGLDSSLVKKLSDVENCILPELQKGYMGSRKIYKATAREELFAANPAKASLLSVAGRIFSPAVQAVSGPIAHQINKQIFSGAFHNWDMNRLQVGRDACIQMGGVGIEMQLPNGAKIDSMYMSSDAFRTKIREAGGEFYTCSSIYEEDRGKKFPILMFKRDNPDLPRLLQSMQVEKSGYLVKEVGDKLYITDPNTAQLKLDFSETSLAKMDFPHENQAGTVILSSGNRGIYEANRSEAFALLMQGVNVMQYNPPGYSLSMGTPSQEGIEHAIDTVIGYTTEVLKVPQEQIVLKGLCLGSGVTAWASARYPATHVILDQAPSAFSELVAGNAPKIPGCALVAGSVAANFLFPNWNNAENLEHNRGQKCIIEATSDDLISHDQIERLLTSAGEDAAHIRMVGAHSTSWASVQPAHYSLANFLKKIGCSDSLFFSG